MSTLPGGRWPLVKMADARAGHMAVPPQARSQGPPGSALSRPWGGHPCQLTSCWLRPHGPLQRLQHPHWGRGSQVCRVSSSVSVFDLVSCCLRLDTFLNLDSGLERPEAPLSPRGRCGHRENGDLAMFPLISLPLRPSRSLPGPAEWRLLLPAPARGVRAQPAGREAGGGGRSRPPGRRAVRAPAARVPPGSGGKAGGFRGGARAAGRRAPDWLPWLAGSPDWLPRGGAWRRAALRSRRFWLRPTPRAALSPRGNRVSERRPGRWERLGGARAEGGEGGRCRARAAPGWPSRLGAAPGQRP